MRRLAALLIVLTWPVVLHAQQAKPDPKPIQDNSFLLEEAYNQEDGVVQHINSFSRSWNSHDWLYSFTQEWPGWWDWRHQFSYTVNVARPGGGSAGMGDTALNYRFQVLGDGDARLAFAPRVSMLLPTGNSDLGRGAGGLGWQTNLPFSFVVNQRLVTHWNAGATIVPRARNAAGDRALTHAVSLGQSFIWQAKPNFNVMLETAWSRYTTVTGPSRTTPDQSLLVSPGIRWAYNLPGGLQIVPGIAAPIGVGPSAGEKGLFVYLSFEHPFRARAKR